MPILRRITLHLLALIPLTTLIHRDDLGRWDVQRSAMAGPDEFSYLLMARNLLHGGGLSLKATLGQDTFYPPGYPLLLAAWARLVNGGILTPFAAHALNALLLSFSTLLVYLLARQLLTLLFPPIPPASLENQRVQLSDRSRDWLAILVAGLFATNWHVLECSLLIMSEPAFMLTSFAWLLLILRWPDWHLSFPKTLMIALLAVAAWSIRGAGLVTITTTFLYPIFSLLHQLYSRKPAIPIFRRLAPITLILLLAIAYQATLLHYAPEKSPFATQQSQYSYRNQLLLRLTDAGNLHFGNAAHWLPLLTNLRNLLFNHLNDFAASFVPWPRENPDMTFRILLGNILAFLALTGWLSNALLHSIATRYSTLDNLPISNDEAKMKCPLPLLHLYLLLYFALYLLWPFDFARFWSPILPIMLIFTVDVILHFSARRSAVPTPAQGRSALILLLLLFTLSVQEDYLQLPGYARRLNEVSDSLSAAVARIIEPSPDPKDTLVAVTDDHYFMLAWYLPPRYTPYSPSVTHSRTTEQMLLGFLNELRGEPHYRIFLISYFGQAEIEAIFTSLRRSDPQLTNQWEIHKVFQRENITYVWEIQPHTPNASQSTISARTLRGQNLKKSEAMMNICAAAETPVVLWQNSQYRANKT